MKRRFKNIIVERRNGREAVYFRIQKGPRVRLPGPVGSPAFVVAYSQASQCYPKTLPPIERPSSSDMAKQEAIDRIYVAVKTCRNRAKRKGWACDVDEEWAVAQITKQEFRCALTGIAFFSKFLKKTKVHPFTPSIDRIDSSSGYTKENVRIVCFAVNAMMMDWGKDLFDQIAKAYRHSELKRNKISPSTDISSPRIAETIEETTA